MKHYFHRLIFVLALTTTFQVTTTQAASDTATITLTATVTAVCTLEAPATVSLGEIPITAFSGKSSGDNLTDYVTTFTLTPTCSGADDYKLTFTASSVGGSCVGSDTGTMRFCLKAGSDDLLFTSGAKSTWSGSDSSVTMTVTPQVGPYTVSVGDITGTVIVTIEPA